jgi:hypothetical protein
MVIKPQLRDQFEEENRIMMKSQPGEMPQLMDPIDTLNKTGRWTDAEHELFLEALLIFGKDWDLVKRHIGSRDSVHIRAHA